MKNKWMIIVGVGIVIAVIGGIALAQKKVIAAPAAPVSAPLQLLLDQAAQAQEKNDQVALKNAYTKIVAEHPEYDNIEQVQQQLGALNVNIILSKVTTPQTVMHEVKVGDSLGKLAKQYGTTKELIKRSNGLKSDVIRVGQDLRIWKAPFNIYIDKSQNILLLKTGEEIVKTYRCSTGKDNSTPVGHYTIVNKIEKPVWFKPGGAPIPPESPDNELGSRWMGFGEDPQYGIHGTTHPEAIGTQASAGCIRLKNEEVEELFDIVPSGTKVTIKD